MLAVKHGPLSRHPGKWEFPGGKIQAGETAEQCIIREIEEELHVQINILLGMEPIVFDYGSKQILLIPFVSEIVSGDIVLTEHVEEYWFELNDWQTINWLEADREIILKNQENIQLCVIRNAL